jgi:zinc transport system substrate-binding protein
MVFLANAPGLAQEAREKVRVFVSILPQKYFVERIAGDLAEVSVLVTPGKSPATYSPTPDQVRKLALAHVYFRIGVSFENGFMHKIASIAPDTRVVDTRKGISMREMEDHIHEQDSHGAHGHQPDGKAEHDLHGRGDGHADMGAGKDPHIWMSPLRVKQQAATMTETLKALAPEHAVLFRENYEAFARDLDRLHARLKTILAPLAGQNFFVFHPAFGYLADDYGLVQVPVETMGRAPKGKELSAIIRLAKEEKTRVIFVQPQFDQQAARKIAAAINGAVVSIDPLAPDYLDNMVKMADTIADAMKP